MENSHNIKGVRIRTLNMVMLTLSIILFGLVLYTTVQISREYAKTVATMTHFLEWEEAARAMRTGSDLLTEQARLYVQTLDSANAKNFFKEYDTDRNREKAVEFLTSQNLHQDHDEKDCDLAKALTLSNALAFREIYAMRLIAEALGDGSLFSIPGLSNLRLTAQDRILDRKAKIERARELLFNIEYQNSKKEINSLLNKFIDGNIIRMRDEQKLQSGRLGEVLSEQRLILIALCLINVLTFGMIIILIIKPLQIYLKCIKNDKMLELVGAYEFKRLAFTYNDIFALKEHHDKMLRHKAEHDPLTGLLNRSAFDSITELLAHDPQPVGLLLIDVDKFKNINDTWGHIMGDRALCRVATLLRHSFRSDDYCIRVGGDEFIVILSGGFAIGEKIITEKIAFINTELQNPRDDLPKLSISVGVAFSLSGYSKDLYDHADQALYRVKSAGRCGCQFYHHQDQKPETAEEKSK